MTATYLADPGARSRWSAALDAASPVRYGIVRSVGATTFTVVGLDGAIGDMVIVDGFQKIGPGAPVTPVCWTDPAGAEDAPTDTCSRAIDALQPAAAN